MFGRAAVAVKDMLPSQIVPDLDPDKDKGYDKLAGTVVVKVKPAPRL